MQTSKAVSVSSTTIGEIDRATDAFAYFLQLYAGYPGMKRETVLKCALAKVWSAARIYQKATDATGNYADAIRLYDSIVKGGAGL